MAVFEKYFSQDLTDSLTTQHCEAIVFSGDNESNIVGVQLYQDGEPAPVTGNVVAYAIRADGNTVTFSGTLANHAASATLPQSCFAAPGPLAIMLQIVAGDVKTTVLRAVFTVEPSTTGAIIDPGSVVPDIADLLSMLDDLEAAIADAEAATDYIAPTETSPAESAHSVGEYIIYDGTLYEVTAPISIGDTLTSGTNISAVPGGATEAFNEQLKTKAPAIIDDTAKANSHTGLTGVRKITFHGNTSAFSSHARYINSRNWIPQMSQTWTANNDNLSLVAAGHFVTYNGTTTAAGTTFAYNTTIDTPLPAGTYKLRIELPTALSSNIQFIILVNYESTPTTQTSVIAKYVGGTLINEFEFTTTEKAVKMGVKVGFAKEVTYTNYTLWLGIYDSTATVVDTGLTVSSSGTEEYTNAALFNLTTIDTMQHESVIAYTADTKTYVDAHTPDIIGFWTDHVYALPEDFGAVGDGVTDDATAIADCLTYAATSGKAVRGFGKYKTSASIDIATRYADVYLREINYTGNSYAVGIKNQDIRFEFGTITSAGNGLLFAKPSSGSCLNNKVSGMNITSAGDCVTVSSYTYYGTCDIRKLNSTNGNCITFSGELGSKGGEYVFRDCTCACVNGWAIYEPTASKFYNFTLEANVKFGIIDPRNCVFFGFRHREQVDAMRRRVIDGDSTTNGPLLKFTVSPSDDGTYANKYITVDSIPWFAIDLTALDNYNTVSGFDEWVKLGFNENDLGVPIIGYSNRKHSFFGCKQLYFIGNHKVAVPALRESRTLDAATINLDLLDSATSDADMATANTAMYYMVTDFVTGVSHTDLYLNASYGAVGFNNLTITQKDGYTCTIYDKLGDELFDGTELGNGVWSLKCAIDRASYGRNTASSGWWCYDGTNETWEITKLS